MTVFSRRDVTSGLPDVSREADERQEARRLADLRDRVKRPRAMISTTEGLAMTLESDPLRAVALYRRFGVTAEHLRAGVPARDVWSRELR